MHWYPAPSAGLGLGGCGVPFQQVARLCELKCKHWLLRPLHGQRSHNLCCAKHTYGCVPAVGDSSASSLEAQGMAEGCLYLPQHAQLGPLSAALDLLRQLSQAPDELPVQPEGASSAPDGDKPGSMPRA